MNIYGATLNLKNNVFFEAVASLTVFGCGQSREPLNPCLDVLLSPMQMFLQKRGPQALPAENFYHGIFFAECNNNKLNIWGK